MEMREHLSPGRHTGPVNGRMDPGSLLSPLTGEFRDKALELEFRRTNFHALRNSVRLLLLILSSMLIAVMAVDLFLAPPAALNWISLSLRGLYVASSLLMFFRISTLSEFSPLALTVTLFEALSICIWFYLAGLVPDVYGQLPIRIGIIALSLMVFLIPNRWIHALVLSAFTFLVAFVLCGTRMVDTTPLNDAVSGLFTLGVVTATAIVTRHMGSEGRNQYLNHAKLLRLSLTDPLTGISNRGRFNEALHSWVRCADQYSMPLSLVLFDFDDFKSINDTYGHLIGDQVILQTVNLVDDAIRRRDLFARWGGEEFTLLFPDTRLEEALEILERLRQTIESHPYIRCGHITASFGVVQYRAGESPEAFMDRADRMLYRAKADGKNCIRAIS